MLKNKKKLENGSIFVITTMLVAFLMILLGGLTTSILMSHNASLNLNNDEYKKIESLNDAYSYYDHLLDGSYLANKDNYLHNIKEDASLYYVTGFSVDQSFKAVLKVRMNDYQVLASNVWKVSE